MYVRSRRWSKRPSGNERGQELQELKAPETELGKTTHSADTKLVSVSKEKLILLLSNDKNFAKRLQELFSYDSRLNDKLAFVPDIVGGEETRLSVTEPKILVVEEGLINKLTSLQGQDPRSLPLLILFDEFSDTKIQNVFGSRYLNLKGFFRKDRVLNDLVESGKFSAVLKEELNLLQPEEEVGVQELGSMIKVEERKSEFTSLFIDVRMRRFVHRMAQILDSISDSQLSKIGERFRDRGYHQDVQGLFEEISSELRKLRRQGEMRRYGSLVERLSEDARKVFKELTEPKEEIPLPMHILLCGETGTGKSLIARWISQYLGVTNFQHINTAGLPPDLMENELFGSLMGAFTDAVSRSGALLNAYGGVVFLDEIGDMKPEIQAKLLIYLDNYSFKPLGWPFEKTIISPCYVIAATNKPLESMVERGEFRSDLYHRFSYKLSIPPLRDRKDDLELLVDLVLQSEKVNPRQKVKGVSYHAMQELANYPFNGNFRELEDILSRAVIRANHSAEKFLLEKHIYGAILEMKGGES